MAQIPAIQGLADSILAGPKRTPVLKVLLYDQSDTLSAIVLGQAQQAPLDITEFVTSCSISEAEESGATADLAVIAKSLSPYHFVGRRIIRIFWRDATESRLGEVCIFTGVTVGQPDFRRSREGNESMIGVKCVDRSFFYNKRKLESPSFLQGQDLGEVAVSIGIDSTYGMGLQREEIRFGLFYQEVQHTVVSFYDVVFFEGLALIGFMADKQPAWNREGFLIMRDTSFTKPSVRKYSDESMFLGITWPATTVDLYNRVRIVGLSSSMSKVVSPEQELAVIRGTAGFFQDKFSTRVYFSEDRQGRAENVYISAKTINGMLSAVLESDAYLSEFDEFSCVLVIPLPYQSWIFAAFFGVYIAFFAMEIFFGFLGISGEIHVMAAIWLTIGLAIMQQLRTFEVTISGTPYKMVNAEIEGVAEWANLLYYEVRELVIENHLVYSQAVADEIAHRELVREKVKQNVRNFTLPHDPFLEVSDIIEMPDGTLYYIQSISKKFARGEAQTMDISALMIRSGLEYNGEEGFSLY